MLSISHQDILAIVVAASFAAGLNVYATVATLGLLSHAHLFELPPVLHLLGSWPVIVVCVALFSLEFVGDKIPVFDLIWNALNTFVRVPVAALITFAAAMTSCHVTGGFVGSSPAFRNTSLLYHITAVEELNGIDAIRPSARL